MHVAMDVVVDVVMHVVMHVVMDVVMRVVVDVVMHVVMHVVILGVMDVVILGVVVDVVILGVEGGLDPGQERNELRHRQHSDEPQNLPHTRTKGSRAIIGRWCERTLVQTLSFVLGVRGEGV